MEEGVPLTCREVAWAVAAWAVVAWIGAVKWFSGKGSGNVEGLGAGWPSGRPAKTGRWPAGVLGPSVRNPF
eukprot:XP_001701695.1 predicted protein [Chlamydomonas reinhardtii]